MTTESDPFTGVPSTEAPPNPPVDEGEPQRSARVASEGKKQYIPEAKEAPDWPSSAEQDRGDRGEELDEGGDGFIDYKDLEQINKELSHLRLLQNFVRRRMRDAKREAELASWRYDQRLRRQLVQQSGGSAETRKAMAELLVEDYEIEMIIKVQVASEWETRLRGTRDDIENTKVVAYNMRNLMPS